MYPISVIAPIKLKENNISFYNNINLLIENAKSHNNFELIFLVNSPEEKKEIIKHIFFKNLKIIVYNTKYQSNRYNQLIDSTNGDLLVFFSYDIEIHEKYWDELLMDCTKNIDEQYFQAYPFNSHLNIHPIIKKNFLKKYRNLIFIEDLFIFYCVDTWISFLISSTYKPKKIENVKLLHNHQPNMGSNNYKIAMLDIFKFFKYVPFLLINLNKYKIDKIDYKYVLKIIIILIFDLCSSIKNLLKIYFLRKI